jgi:hypothetical protein
MISICNSSIGDFCRDPFVSAVVDAVTDQYTDTEQIANALNMYVNKTGWAYLVYKVTP